MPNKVPIPFVFTVQTGWWAHVYNNLIHFYLRNMNSFSIVGWVANKFQIHHSLLVMVLYAEVVILLYRSQKELTSRMKMLERLYPFLRFKNLELIYYENFYYLFQDDPWQFI